MDESKQYDNLFRWAVDALDLTITVDKQGFVRHVGKTYAEILGLSQTDIIGRYIEEVVPNSELLRIIQTGKPEYGSVFVMKNGTPIIVNRLPILDEAGEIHGAISVTSISDLGFINSLNNKISRLQKENNCYRLQLEVLTSSFSIDSIIGVSPSIKNIKKLIQKVAASAVSVLLTGETGTGKEVFANALHQLSNRRQKNYVKINCAAIPKDLFESELFGYREGAFSGAKRGGKQGKFELANGGTILLDEIGEIPLNLQAKLLRTLQEQEMEPLGGLNPVKLNVRIVCSTNRDLRQLVNEGLFREDLYYRINAMEIHIPPLRERGEDVLLFCDQFIQEANIRYGCLINGVTEKAKEILMDYNWPGNVRELKHTLERACIMKMVGKLDLENFDFLLPRILQSQTTANRTNTLPDQKRNLELKTLLDALSQTGGNKSQAAKLLGISRSVLYEKMKRYDI